MATFAQWRSQMARKRGEGRPFIFKSPVPLRKGQKTFSLKKYLVICKQKEKGKLL